MARGDKPEHHAWSSVTNWDRPTTPVNTNRGPMAYADWVTVQAADMNRRGDHVRVVSRKGLIAIVRD